MRGYKKYIYGILLVLTVGMGAITTKFYTSGTIKITTNTTEFVDGVVFDEDSITVSDGLSYTISDDGKTISFTTPKLESISSSATLTYKVKNDSQYDATISSIDCYFIDGSTKTTENEYLTVTPSTSLIGSVLKANGSSTQDATITVTQIKSYASKTDTTIKFECVLQAIGVESSN